MRTRMTLWIKIRMMKMMRLMMTMLPRSAAPLEEAWEEHLARWEPTGTGSCGVVLYAGKLTTYRQVLHSRGLSRRICLLNFIDFSLLLSLGLIVALVVVSNRTPAGHMVNNTQNEEIET